jgi:hypothetical protein
VHLSLSAPGEVAQTTTVRSDSVGVAAPVEWILGGAAGWNRLSASIGSPSIATREYEVYAFPVFSRVPIAGPQPPFTTGITFNRLRDALTAVHPSNGIAELSPDGDTWTTVVGSAPTSGRVYAAVHEQAQQLLVISAALGPVYWDYAAEQWFSASAGDAPTARDYPAMAYDPERKVVVLYGGIVFGGSSDPVADVYEWDGSRWAALGPAPSGPRAGHGMAYAPTLKRMFTHGGVDQGAPFGGRAVRTTWARGADGAWQSLNAELPENVAAAPMAYDEVRGTLVMVGGTRVGSGGYGLSDAVWEFVDGHWVRSASSSPAGQRVLSGLVYVPSRQGLLLFGSEHAGWNDVWFYGAR